MNTDARLWAIKSAAQHTADCCRTWNLSGDPHLYYIRGQLSILRELPHDPILLAAVEQEAEHLFTDYLKERA